MRRSCLRSASSTKVGYSKTVRWSTTGIVILSNGECKTRRLDEEGKLQHISKPERPSIPKEFLEQTPYSTERAELQGGLEILDTTHENPKWIPIWAKLIRKTLIYYPNRTTTKPLGIIELNASSQVTRGRKFHIDGGAFIMFAFQVVNEDIEHCFSASTGAVITTWVTSLTKTISLLNPTLMFRTDITPRLCKPGSLSESISRNRRARLDKARSGTYLKQSDQQQRLDYLTAAPIIPPKELQRVSRSRSIGEDEHRTQQELTNQKYSEEHFCGVASTDEFLLVESATDVTQRRRRGEVMVVSHCPKPLEIYTITQQSLHSVSFPTKLVADRTKQEIEKTVHIAPKRRLASSSPKETTKKLVKPPSRSISQRIVSPIPVQQTKNERKPPPPPKRTQSAKYANSISKNISERPVPATRMRSRSNTTENPNNNRKSPLTSPPVPPPRKKKQSLTLSSSATSVIIKKNELPPVPPRTKKTAPTVPPRVQHVKRDNSYRRLSAVPVFRTNRAFT